MSADWHTRFPLDTEGMNAYVQIIRSPDDPERETRAESRARGADALEWRKVSRRSPELWADEIGRHLADGEARTMNRLSVELANTTADVTMGTTFHEGLALLVGRGVVECTLEAPMLFRDRYAAPP